MAAVALVAIREALVSRLRNDGALTTLLGSANRIFHRPHLSNVEPRSVTYFDFGSRPDATVPLRDRRFQVDVWDTDPVRIMEIADRVEVLLDNQPWGGLPASGTKVVNVVHMQLIRDSDVIADSGDLLRVTLEFRVIAYRL